MKVSRGDMPIVIARVVDDVVEACRKNDVHGIASVRLERVNDESFYIVAVRIPASATVAGRHMAPPKSTK